MRESNLAQCDQKECYWKCLWIKKQYIVNDKLTPNTHIIIDLCKAGCGGASAYMHALGDSEVHDKHIPVWELLFMWGIVMVLIPTGTWALIVSELKYLPVASSGVLDMTEGEKMSINLERERDA